MNWISRKLCKLMGVEVDEPIPMKGHRMVLYPTWYQDLQGIWQVRMPKTVLYPYQEKGVRRMVHRYEGRCLNADEMGLGKSIQALVAGLYAGWFPHLIICPAHLKKNWQREVKKHIGMNAHILYGRTPETDRDARRALLKKKILIINYDILEGWFNFLCDYNPMLVTIDECHYMANKDSKRTSMVTDFCVDIPYIFALSGTAITQRPSELYATLHILRPDIYNSWFAYGIEYCKPTRERGRLEFKGAKNLDKLHEELKENVMVRRRKKDVLPDLPKKARFVVPVEISNRKEYERAENDFLGWLYAKHKNKLIGAAKAEGLVKRGYLRRLVGQLKMQAILEWLDDYMAETDGKVIVFTWHTDILHTIFDRYKNMAVYINGERTHKQRDVAEQTFQTDDRCRMLVGQIKACGTGLNLTAASTTVAVELAWKPADHSQGEARIDRIGQTLPTSHYYLIGENTVEEDICQLIQKKQKIVDEVLDGEAQAEDMDAFYDELVRALKKRGKRVSVDIHILSGSSQKVEKRVSYSVCPKGQHNERRTRTAYKRMLYGRYPDMEAEEWDTILAG